MFATATALAARAFYTLVPIRPRPRGERRSLRTFASPAISPSPPRARRASSSRSTRAVSHRVRASSTIAPSMPPLENDAKGVERLQLREDGWKFWRWRDHRCHYISAGEDNDGPIVVLVHGFGAHSYHWRYTIPSLARKASGSTPCACSDTDGPRRWRNRIRWRCVLYTGPHTTALAW